MPRDDKGRFVSETGKSKATPGKAGRPPGRKNKLTLLKEAEQKRLSRHAVGMMALELPRIVQAIVDVAKDPEHRHWPVAAKLATGPFFDAVKENPSSGLNVQINITGVEHGQTIQGRVTEVHGNGAEVARPVLEATGRESGTESPGRPSLDVHHAAWAGTEEEGLTDG